MDDKEFKASVLVAIILYLMFRPSNSCRSVIASISRLYIKIKNPFFIRRLVTSARSDKTVLARWGEFLETHGVIPSCVYNSNLLPLPKSRILAALLRQLFVATDPEWRGTLTYALAALSRFQAGVAGDLIDPYGSALVAGEISMEEFIRAIAALEPPDATAQALIAQADAETARMMELVRGGPREVLAFVNRRRLGME